MPRYQPIPTLFQKGSHLRVVDRRWIVAAAFASNKRDALDHVCLNSDGWVVCAAISTLGTPSQGLWDLHLVDGHWFKQTRNVMSVNEACDSAKAVYCHVLATPDAFIPF